MQVKQISIERIRNLVSVSLEPVSGVNQLVGPNGAGKTSVLEAIHTASTGHSFRTRKTHSLLQHSHDDFIIRLLVMEPSSELEHRIGLQKTRAGETHLKLDYARQNSIVEVSRLLPVKVITPDSHDLVQQGPDQRRQFLDWGLFHVKHEFHAIWKDYRRSLQQRNTILKINPGDTELMAWDKKLAVTGEQLHALRANYVEELSPKLGEICQQLLLGPEVTARYRSGWLAGTALAEALNKEQEQVVRPAFTTVGPHRAELALLVSGKPAKEVLSRGEQKLLVYALHLAQLQLFVNVTGRRPLVLIDDLSAELDETHQLSVVQTLTALSCQTFITGNSIIKSVESDAARVFMMTGGNVAEVL